MKTLKSTLGGLAVVLSLFIISCGQGTHEEHQTTDSAATSQNTTIETPAATATLNLSVEGMTCDNCANALKTALTSVPGVQSCEVNFENKTTTISYDNSKTTEEALLTAVATTHDGKFKASKVSEPIAQATVQTACDASCTKPCCKGKEGEAKTCTKESKDCCKKGEKAEATTKEACTKDGEKKCCSEKKETEKK
jgi:copper chaperone CopZ